MIAKQILVVDDEDHIREVVRICLHDLGGWETLGAASGQECLQILQTEKPDAILLDLSMPGMDGFAVYECLQSNPITRSIPVIVITAKVLPSDRAKFAQMGVAGVIYKPFQALNITEEISRLLGWLTS